MHRPSFRKTTLSLLGLATKSSATTASAQSTPSSASLANLSSFSPSTETLVPTPTASETAPTRPTSDFAFTVSPAQPTGNATTVGAQTTSGQRFSGTGSNTAVVYRGEAVPTGYRKIGLAGALAGAAGVFMV
ncbi:hypothetical protein P171DRAFT_70360 [Karstenula rhodostoma CBS 690.94]|uniref:Uncharacterized protein n=1 Tax=Karstenula rhodostoma CBS 690.94 TaxID=1392251 RepID=A0A9P4PER7_9PLEO|nr:hypothetical protein P171DRAFT_70360 [Karstenula rhodostoma CBS 690.94]